VRSRTLGAGSRFGPSARFLLSFAEASLSSWRRGLMLHGNVARLRGYSASRVWDARFCKGFGPQPLRERGCRFGGPVSESLQGRKLRVGEALARRGAGLCGFGIARSWANSRAACLRQSREWRLRLRLTDRRQIVVQGNEGTRDRPLRWASARLGRTPPLVADLDAGFWILRRNPLQLQFYHSL
jgi:hypothetical protein